MISFFSRTKDPTIERYDATRPGARREKVAIQTLPFALLDAETTGFRVGRDRLLTLGLLPVERLQIEAGRGRSWTVYHPNAPLTEAVKVHGILPSEAQQGLDEKEVLSQLLETLRSAVIVGHHIHFDLAMLNEAARRHFGARIKNRVVDTAIFAMQELPAFERSGYARQPPPSLEDVCSNLGIKPVDRHTALGDAYTTGLIFLKLCARLARRLGRPPLLRDLPKSL